MSTVLGFWDLIWISVIVVIFGGGSAAYALRMPSDSVQLRRIDAKLDLVLKRLELEHQDSVKEDGLSEEVKALAADPARKIAAIKLLREQTGMDLKDAKDAVEAYIGGRGRG